MLMNNNSAFLGLLPRKLKCFGLKSIYLLVEREQESGAHGEVGESVLFYYYYYYMGLNSDHHP